jgi:hypothetical protein
MSDDERDESLDDVPALSKDEELEVIATLRSLPPVTMPADVQARLETALAAAVTDHPVAGAGGPDWAADATIVPLSARRRRSAALLRVAAAVLVLVAGVGAIGWIGAQLSGSGEDAGGSSVAAASDGGRNAVDSSASEVKLYATGAQYTDDSIATQAQALAVDPSPPVGETTFDLGSSASASPSAAEGAEGPATGSGSAPGPQAVPGVEPELEVFASGPIPSASLPEAAQRWRQLGTAAVLVPALPACLATLVEPGDVVIAVDAATFDGEPAYVIVGRASDSGDRLWYFAVRPTCLDPGTTDTVVLRFGTVAAG